MSIQCMFIHNVTYYFINSLIHYQLYIYLSVWILLCYPSYVEHFPVNELMSITMSSKALLLFVTFNVVFSPFVQEMLFSFPGLLDEHICITL
jgi:hypothetical protein